MTIPTPPLAVHLPSNITIRTTSTTTNPFDTPEVQISRPSSPTRLPNELDFIKNLNQSDKIDLENSLNNSRNSSWDRLKDITIASTTRDSSRGGSQSRDPSFKKLIITDGTNGSNSIWSKLLGSKVQKQHEIELELPRGRRLSNTGELTLGIRTTNVEDVTLSIKKSNKKKGLRIMSRTTAQLVVSFSLIALVGMNDSATGANLSSMQAHYEVTYDQISIVFLSNVAGYFISCLSSSFLTHHLGLQYSLVVACFVLSLGCLIMAIAPPFPVFVSALSLLGFGSGLFDACLTTVISYDEDPVIMSYMYACFGVGATFSPLIIGGFVDRSIAWNLYYFIPLAIVIALTIAAFPIFANYKPPQDEPNHSLPSTSNSTTPSTSTHPIPLTTTTTTMSTKISHGEIGGGVVGGKDRINNNNAANIGIASRMTKALKMRAVWVGFVLVILAFGIGDTLSAWMVSFMVEKRDAPAAASRYQLSGVWAGIAIGRVALAFLGKKLGEKTFSILMLFAASIFLGIVWGIKNVTIDAIALVLVGFFIGPVTPRVLSMVSARIPPSLKSSVMSMTIGLGLIGSSVGPLAFGVVAGKGGLENLPGVLIGASVIAAVGWMLVPRKIRRED